MSRSTEPRRFGFGSLALAAAGGFVASDYVRQDPEPARYALTASVGSFEGAGDGFDVYFRNCSDARAAGAAPVRYGDPGYASHLDRDNGGVGCE